MKFTDRFIKVPVDFYDISKANVIGYNSETNEGQSYVKLLPMDISFYRPAVDDHENLTQTIVHLRNGESFHIKLDTKKFEDLLNVKMED